MIGITLYHIFPVLQQMKYNKLTIVINIMQIVFS